MNRKWIARLFWIVIVLVGTAFWHLFLPAVPEWRLHVVDSDGRAAVGAMAVEEWLDPSLGETTVAQDGETDANGAVVFPQRAIHRRLSSWKSLRARPVARITVCTEDQYGVVLWNEDNREMASRMELKKGPCPTMGRIWEANTRRK